MIVVVNISETSVNFYLTKQFNIPADSLIKISIYFSKKCDYDTTRTCNT